MKKKILISAYACEPNKGSEPGVGWKWAYYLSLNSEYEIHVLTRKNNEKKITQYCNENQIHTISFHYYDLPGFFLWLKKHGFSVNLYYAFWQIGVVKLALDLHKKNNFHLVHHLTFGVFRDASLLYKLKTPFVFGPVGGGEYTPRLLANYKLKYQLKEKIRKIANKVALINPFLNRMFAECNIIWTKTSDTKDVIPIKWHYKTYNNLEIGIEKVVENIPISRDKKTFLYVGRFIYWKGLKILLYAFKTYLKHYDSEAQLFLIGKGEYKKEIVTFIEENELYKNIKIIPWINQEELKSYYELSTAFIFPSLHDSSGNVVLEALSFALPVISLDCGGPASVMGDMLKDTIISTTNKKFEEVVQEIANKMNELVKDEVFYDKMVENSRTRACQLLWENVIESSYKTIFEKLESK